MSTHGHDDGKAARHSAARSMPRAACRPGGRTPAGLVVGAGLLALRVAAADNRLPNLLPPHGELPPTFWEQNGWSVAIIGLATLAILALLVALMLLLRPSRVAVTSPEVIARRALEALRGRPEDGAWLVAVSAVLRRYVVLACGLPAHELTTGELCRELASRPRFPGELVSAIAGFLRQCDERKFAPAPPAAQTSAVDAALELVERVESHCRESARTAAAAPAGSVAAAPS